MKIKPKTAAKYARYLSLCREDEPRPLPQDRVPVDAQGCPAVEAFHVWESSGRIVGTREPELLEKYHQGKRWHGVTVEAVAAGLNEGTTSPKEIRETYPEWVSDEIVAAAAKAKRR